MKELNYALAFEELQTIVGEMETGDISIDELSIKVKRAAELIQICKRKLKSTELDVQKILDELDDASENN
ncbi:MAG: exodeoxyribonuclease VII small subunit [Flavobacteriia bacterium]|nr:exodeoxyribonuclease VII small subunit [Flavobacteriia bacterium]